MIDILTSERHLKVLQEKEVSHQMGNFCDELIRHHPSLKEPLLNAIIAVLKRLKELGSKVPADEDSVYTILPKDAVLSKKGDVIGEKKEGTGMSVDEQPSVSTFNAGAERSNSAVVDTSTSTSNEASSSSAPADADPAPAAAKSNPTDQEAYVDNLVVLFIGVTARVSLISPSMRLLPH